MRVRTHASCGTSIESNEIQLNVGVPSEPGPPAALVSSVAGNTVTLTWQAGSGVVDGYLLEAGSAPGSAGLASVPLGAVGSLARAFEQATEWHTRRPPLTPDTPVPPLKRPEGA